MIPYRLSTEIWLSLESFYNAGLTPEQAKEAIETVRGDNGGALLHAESSGFNGNWIVGCRYAGSASVIVSRIETALFSKLRELNEHPPSG